MQGAEVFWEAFWDGFTLAGLTGSSRHRQGAVYHLVLKLCSGASLTASLAVLIFLIMNRFYTGVSMLFGAIVVMAVFFARQGGTS